MLYKQVHTVWDAISKTSLYTDLIVPYPVQITRALENHVIILKRWS